MEDVEARRAESEKLGEKGGRELMTLLSASDSLRGDIAELRHEMQLGFARTDEPSPRWRPR
jgi:hypothetical protein